MTDVPSQIVVDGNTFRLEHEYRHGWHMITSDDVYGLYVAHPSLKKVISDLEGAIRLLVEHNGLSKPARP